MRTIAAVLLFFPFLNVPAAQDATGPVYHPSRPSALSFALFHSKVPSVRLDAGPGYEAGGRIFFPVVYAIYYPAKGIARFPDGGRAAQGYAAAWLFEHVPGETPRPAAKIGLCDLFQEHRAPMVNRNGGLIIKIPALNRLHVIEGGRRLDSAYYYFFDPADGSLTPLDAEPDWPEKYPRSGLKDHYSYFEPATADIEELGLPSPLPYIAAGRSDAVLRSAALGSRGNRLLRMTIFRRWLKDGKRELSEKTLDEMRKKVPALPAVRKQVLEADIAAAERILSGTEKR
ncbi:MAG: hypothetical protein RQ748_12605 [Elusimicrobiales bacterium]|nr:hypothetical protein [Elusimicrobiales bacterium]